MNSFQRKLKLLDKNKEIRVTEEEIKKEHDEVIKYVGTKTYQFFLPLIEIQQALIRMLQLNHEMHKLKSAPKAEIDTKQQIKEAKEPL